jgi:lipoyl(octanoyl) transferase
MHSIALQNKNVFFRQLGLVDYKEAWDMQEEVFAGIVNRKIANRTLPEAEQLATENYLFFCQHPHVYTLGKSGSESHLLADEALLQAQEAVYYKINRGGDITYHGPGQLVGYPLLDLDNFFTDIHKYLRFIEEAVILTLAEWGIEAGRIPGLTGVWLDHVAQQRPRKICAIGVKSSRWVTMHGFALNVNTNLAYFNNIVPCGITDKAVTSLAQELGHEVAMEEVEEKMLRHLASLFEMTVVHDKPLQEAK